MTTERFDHSRAAIAAPTGRHHASRIPRVLHYVFGMAPDFGGKPWSLIHYVCLKSAITHIRPERVFLYYEYEPVGPWWELSRDLVTPVKMTAPREIFGNPLAHVAHRSDVVRLQRLIEHGGIYLDADVLVHRDFDDLLGESVVLGREGDIGIANAVILAEANAPFLRRWLEAYRSFNGVWNEHSVVVPARLAAEYPEEITVLSDKAFFWPLWHDDHIDWIFTSTKTITLDRTYANHLWESIAWCFLQDLTPRQVRKKDTNFHLWARPYLEHLSDDCGEAPNVGQLMTLAKRVRTSLTMRYLRALTTRVRRRAGNAEWKLKHLAQKAILRPLSKGRYRRQVFQDAYKYNLWGKDPKSQFYSGVGSRGIASDEYATKMASLIGQYANASEHPQVIVDLGCGDFQVASALLGRLRHVTYVGCDIVPDLIAHNNKTYATDAISFRCLDIVRDPLPVGDICLVRQVFQHLSNSDIAIVLQRLKPYKLVYVTEGHPEQRLGPINPDKVVGADVRFDWKSGRGRGVELDQAPFSASVTEQFRTFAPPHEVIITQQLILNTSSVDALPAHSGQFTSARSLSDPPTT
jgi:SAM-dependent methyltransferase